MTPLASWMLLLNLFLLAGTTMYALHTAAPDPANPERADGHPDVDRR